MLAAIVAGLLVLVIAVMLMILKISFLLLLVAGPIFLGIGIHPGIGRVIAVRWFELLLSTLLKQAALIGVLALLLWSYGLIMAESLPWGLQILLISLVTLAAFIYRKPFQHLFAAVGYSAVGSRKSEEHLEEAVRETRKRTTSVAAAAATGAAAYRFGRWGKRDTANLSGGRSLMGDDPRDLELANRDAAWQRPAIESLSAFAAAGVAVRRQGERQRIVGHASFGIRRLRPPGRRRPRGSPSPRPSQWWEDPSALSSDRWWSRLWWPYAATTPGRREWWPRMVRRRRQWRGWRLLRRVFRRWP